MVKNIKYIWIRVVYPRRTWVAQRSPKEFRTEPIAQIYKHKGTYFNLPVQAASSISFLLRRRSVLSYETSSVAFQILNRTGHCTLQRRSRECVLNFISKPTKPLLKICS
jgi:hypothetical protein